MTSSSLDLAVLGLLKEGPMHGYELRKRLGPLWAVSFGSLYPCLKRLRKAGWVKEAELPVPAPAKRRRRKADEVDARSRARRVRKVYEITPEGERVFFEQLERGAVYDTDRFHARFAFFRYLPAERRIGLLERRKAHLQDKLVEFKDSLDATRARIDGYTRSLIEHGMDATERDIRWLDTLIDQERAACAPRASRRA